MKKTPTFKLYVQDLRLPVFLGWEEYERSQLQEISISLELEFKETPLAYSSDDLNESICYETICKILKDGVSKNTFRTVEKLTQEIKTLLESKLSVLQNYKIRLHKLNPPIEGLMGGVVSEENSFSKMATVFLSLGSNLGERRKILESAIHAISKLGSNLSVSSIYENPAALLPGSPSDWNQPYLNLAIRMETLEEPTTLLKKLQGIELEHGRERMKPWSPRTLDIDMIHWEGESHFHTEDLTLPHPRALDRHFVLAPVSELSPHLIVNSQHLKNLSRAHPQYRPQLMGILNLTPDSFSDGGRHDDLESLSATLDAWDKICIPYIDLGAESTRPGAISLTPTQEWARLKPVLEFIHERYAGKWIRPKISVDTRNASTAKQALALGCEVINDVSGLADPEMLDVLRHSSCSYILMHSLSVPAQTELNLDADLDPLREIIFWFKQKLDILQKSGISLERITLDPGIGFGKTSLQSSLLIREIEQLRSLGQPLLCGHSRKSLLKNIAPANAADRDIETLGMSFALAEKKVDVLRVHDPVLHHRAFLAWMHGLSA